MHEKKSPLTGLRQFSVTIDYLIFDHLSSRAKDSFTQAVKRLAMSLNCAFSSQGDYFSATPLDGLKN